MCESVVAMWMPGPLEWVFILVVALLIFGRRLPDVARSMGKSIVEFKKGLRDVKEDMDTADSGEKRILPDNAEPQHVKPPNSDRSKSGNGPEGES